MLGSVAQDTYLYVRGGFSLGCSRVAESFRIGGGGSAANTAVALARLGLEVGFMGAVGDDDVGSFLRDDLRREGVDISQVQVLRDHISSRVYVIVDLDTGERGMVGIRDADNFLQIKNMHYISKSRILHISGYMLQNEPGGSRTLRIMREAKEAGVTLSLDLTQEIAQRSIIKKVGKIDFLLGNESEFRLLGYEPSEVSLRVARSELGCENIVVKLGSRGSAALIGEEFVYKEAFRVKVVDTTGAGDAFNAGFLYGVFKKYSPEFCLEIGNALGAYACTGEGARHLPKKEEVESMIGRRI